MPDSFKSPQQPSATPQVRTQGDRRSLEFRPGMIQSEMRLSRPDELVLRYARAMMCFALFQPRPRHIVMVGLGGGSLAKFCYRHLPEARITVLELRADVIALREQFHIPPDDARFRVIHADAADYLARTPASADVLLVDGFDEAGMPAALGSARFYADCRRALLPGGVLVANLFSYDRHYAAMLGRLRLTFRDRICWFDGIAGNNRIIFAVRADPGAAAPARPLRVQRLVALRRRLGLGFLNALLARLLVRRLSRRGRGAAP
ncbi:fused MFS/spermidine synthase [Janthinobacterium sp. hw3]|uniref:Fused MFS/spermidine synthase n=2 Tax=Janthinobacterium fluminis TaxID=2987524 RepID=A0ABT5JVI3_9BURK|nr:fused MFS/spermidine synthase [Janthinobacterium fluminis]MDC8756190.1 fused MFS/spermidine synthase [Janthinobacterium fluminis]